MVMGFPFTDTVIEITTFSVLNYVNLDKIS